MSAAQSNIVNNTGENKEHVVLQLSTGAEALPTLEAAPNSAGFFGKRSISADTKTDIFDAMEYQVLKPTQTVKDSSFTVETIKDKELCFGTYANRAPNEEANAGNGAAMGSGIVKYNDKMIKVRMAEVNAANADEMAIAKEDLNAAKGTGLGQTKGKKIPTETSFRINLEVSALEINAMKGGPKVYVMRDGRPNATVNSQVYELEPNDIVISMTPALVDILTHKIGEEIISPEGKPMEIPLGKILIELIKKSTHNGGFDAMDFGIQLTELLRENKLPSKDADKIVAGSFFAYQIR